MTEKKGEKLLVLDANAFRLGLGLVSAWTCWLFLLQWQVTVYFGRDYFFACAFWTFCCWCFGTLCGGLWVKHSSWDNAQTVLEKKVQTETAHRSSETNDEYQLTIDLPGVEPKDVQVYLDVNLRILFVKGKRMDLGEEIDLRFLLDGRIDLVQLRVDQHDHGVLKLVAPRDSRPPMRIIEQGSPLEELIRRKKEMKKHSTESKEGSNDKAKENSHVVIYDGKKGDDGAGEEEEDDICMVSNDEGAKEES